MQSKDIHGNSLSGANAAAVEHFERGCALFRCYIGDPLAEAQAAVDAAPDMPMAHALVGYLNLLGTEPAGYAVAQTAFTQTAGKPANERERLHLGAVDLLSRGQWHAAGRVLEDLSI